MIWKSAFMIQIFLIMSSLCLSASVFLASAPPRVGESIHFRKHCQQRLGSRNHNSIRWGVQTQAVVFPSLYPLAWSVNPVTFLLFQTEKVKSNHFRANLHLSFCLRNNFFTKQRWFVAWNNWECWTFSVFRCGRSWAYQHQCQHFHHVWRREHLERGNGPPPLICDVTVRLHYDVPSDRHSVSEIINIFLPLNFSLRLRQRDGNKKGSILKKIWKTRWTKVGIWLSLQRQLSAFAPQFFSAATKKWGKDDLTASLLQNMCMTYLWNK